MWFFLFEFNNWSSYKNWVNVKDQTNSREHRHRLKHQLQFCVLIFRKFKWKTFNKTQIFECVRVTVSNTCLVQAIIGKKIPFGWKPWTTITLKIGSFYSYFMIFWEALADLSDKTLSGRMSCGGTSRTTPSMESYSSSRRANFLRNTFSNSISSNVFTFSAAWTWARLE